MNNRISINKVIELRDTFNIELQSNLDNFSEETIRAGYLNKLLEIFGWNISSTTEVIQEKKLGEKQTARLKKIDSTHTKPDYTLQDGGVPRMYLDAKDIRAKYLNDNTVGFQIRSYGWSTNFKISVVSDFKNFTVFDTTFKPDISMKNEYKSITFTIDDLVNDIEKYGQFLDKEIIQNQNWDFSELELDFQVGDSRSLDDDFLNLIKAFRLKLAEGFLSNTDYNENKVSYIVQLTINRMLFLRILEDNNFEPREQLLNWYNNGQGFWQQFAEESNHRFYQIYDGALFDEKLPEDININDNNFSSFINSLYGYAPYRFDVIKPEIISEIYDIFLGEEVKVGKDGSLYHLEKDISPEGNVPTPEEITLMISEEVIDLNGVNTLEDIYNIKIIDPCCGSGAFLVAAFDVLLKHAQDISDEELDYQTVKNIITCCLFGVDVDPIAIEVVKMTMSIKLILSDYEKPITPFEKLLSDFENNYKLGNSIVDSQITEVISDYSQEEQAEQFPTDYTDIFPKIMSEGGFDYILTNPPYIEPKHYKSLWPQTYSYLRSKYITNTGKSDISMFFLERIFDLINDDGRLGLVIQKRFFTTDYGRKMRNWLAENGYLTTVKEYKENDMFKNRTTYVAILYGRKNKIGDKVDYYYSDLSINKERSNLKGVLSNYSKYSRISDINLEQASIWGYQYLRAFETINDLPKDRFVYLNDLRDFKLIVGPQVLDKKFYVLYNSKKSNGIIRGQNLNGDTVEIEANLTRALYENKNMKAFTKFREEDQRTFIIYPYNSDAKLLAIDHIKHSYHKAYEYFLYVKDHSTNQFRRKTDEFHGYTRVQNLQYGNTPKLFMPMTSKRVIASFADIEVFGDNSNITSLISISHDIRRLKSYAVIFNSELFTLLTLPLSGDARGGYKKMNKQFIGNVPAPLLSDAEGNLLSRLYDNIIVKIRQIKNAYGDSRGVYIKELEKLQRQQNEWVYQKYAYSDEGIKLLKSDVDLDEINWLRNDYLEGF